MNSYFSRRALAAPRSLQTDDTVYTALHIYAIFITTIFPGILLVSYFHYFFIETDASGGK